MELEQYFSHDHPLILQEEHKDDGVEVSCNGCQWPISGSSYDCLRCQFFLHKSCAELPRKMTHPSHLEHTLTLLTKPARNGYYRSCKCDVCGVICTRFVYHCSNCDFNVDMRCARGIQQRIEHSVQQRIQHRSHRHQLIPLQKRAMFLCDACGTKHEGTSYLCTTCGFWISQKCASLPRTIKVSNHHHPLTLFYSLPYLYNNHLEFFEATGIAKQCQICAAEVMTRHWVYCCAECICCVHVNCATSETKVTWFILLARKLVDFLCYLSTFYYSFRGFRNYKAEIPELVALPLRDESVHPITQFIKNIGLHGKYKEAKEIRHVSHDHLLIFSDKQIDDELSSGSKLLLLNEVKNVEKCNGCAQPISAPFYGCSHCNFSLHQWCAELPNELRHPCHPEHPLLLITQQSTNFHLYQCQGCGLHCNAFIFGCSTCKFYLDSKCASLPHVITHEAHKHILTLNLARSGSCSACNNDFTELAFLCDPCNLNLCIRCALLPRNIRHRYDKHPFILTYSPVKDQADECFCEICERDINSKYWFYHCASCDQSLHTKCIQPVDEKSNIKYGVTFNFDDHPHLLTCVRSPKENGPCGSCGRPFLDHYMAFECAPCNFWIHDYCAIY